MKQIILLFCLLISFANAQTRRDTAVSPLGDKVPVLKVFIGTVAQLRALNNSTYVQAQTTDFGGGDWYKVAGDVTTPDNGGTVIVDAAGNRWRRRYYGLDEVKWYYATPGTDSAVVRRANENCRQGLHFDTLVYNLHKFRPRSNRIYEGTPGKTVWRLTNASATDPTDWRAIVFFQDSATKYIKNVTFQGITFNGNSNNQLNTNTVNIRFGGNFGGSGTDTTTDITFDNCVWDSCKGRASLWLLSDTNRNKNIIVKNSVFKNAQVGHVEIRGAKDMTFDNVEWYNWTIADSTASSCFGGTNGSGNHPAAVRLTVNNCRFFNYHGDRFTTEISGTVLASTFTENKFYGNGLDVNGYSGPAWFTCTFDGNKMYNGGGGHRSGFELVGGGGNLIIKNYIQNGSITIGSNPRSAIVVPVGMDSTLNSGFTVEGNIVENYLGGAMGIGGHDSLRNVLVKNNYFKTTSTAISFQQGGVRYCQIESNTIETKAFYNVRFYDVYWSAADSASKYITFKNNSFNSPGLSLSNPNILISTTESVVFNKYKNVTFEGNQYSQNNLYYKDSAIATWTITNNRRLADTSKTFYYDNKASIGRGIGNPTGVVYADFGSLFYEIVTKKWYRKDTDITLSTGWSELVTTSGSGNGGSSGQIKVD